MTPGHHGIARTVKAQVFLRRMTDFPIFEAVWRRRFSQPPARSVVQVSDLPVDGALVAVEVTARPANLDRA